MPFSSTLKQSIAVTENNLSSTTKSFSRCCFKFNIRIEMTKMFPNNNKNNKYALDENLFPLWMKNSESDVMDDLLLAIQNIVAGTAIVSYTTLSENCFQYKIHLSEDFPLITLQYEMKLDRNESVHMIPVIENKEISENIGMCQSSSSKHDGLEDTLKDVTQSSIAINIIKQEIPEFLSVLNNTEDIEDKELVSFDCLQDNQQRISHSEMKNSTKSSLDPINKCGITKSIGASVDNSHLLTSVSTEWIGNCENTTGIKRSNRIAEKKKNGNKKDEETIDSKEKMYSCSYRSKLFIKKSTKCLNEEIDDSEKPCTCEACGEGCIHSCHLIDQKRIDKSETLFVCEICSMSFTQPYTLIEHKRIHTGDKPYACEECGKLFSYLSHLTRHKRFHTGEKPFECEECGKCFIQLNNLSRHKRTHTGEKPFTCDECGKCFIQLSNLIRHKRIHTGEKPYACGECGKCFTDLSNLNRHERIHTGEKPFKCEECGKPFADLSHLTRHKKLHAGENPFTSEECGKCFNQ